MAASPAQLPAFPCWCRATYSWGGETKKDLGFIEGDLIEALNAGDGLWWMGRLRRDPRAVGLFPSNFVAVLDRSFRPAPNSSRNATPPTHHTPPSKQAHSTPSFRKPFQAYGSVQPASAAGSREGTPESEREKNAARNKRSKFRPYSSMKTAQAPTGTIKKQAKTGGGTATSSENVEDSEAGFRIPQPPPRRSGHRSRAVSPLVQQVSDITAPTAPAAPAGAAASRYRASSPQPGYRSALRPLSPTTTTTTATTTTYNTYHNGSTYPPSQILPSPSYHPSQIPHQLPDAQHSRAPSAASFAQYNVSRGPSPAFEKYDDVSGLSSPSPSSSPPPPPPPVHRVAYHPSRAPSPQHFQEDYVDHRPTTPAAHPSPSVNNMTPSPLRDAMNDVMTSLQDMSTTTSHIEPDLTSNNPNDVWSPDAYDLVRTRSQYESRPKSSLGFDRTAPFTTFDDVHPDFNSHAQRLDYQVTYDPMMLDTSSEQPPAPPLKGSQYGGTRPTTSSSSNSSVESGYGLTSRQHQARLLRHRKSAYELAPDALNRTYTTKTNATNSTINSSNTQSSAATQLTSRSIMSGHSAGGFSATSAGSLARRKFGLGSQHRRGLSNVIDVRSSTQDLTGGGRALDMLPSEEGSGSGPSYHESHSSSHLPLATPTADWTKDPIGTSGVLGGLSAPRAKKKSGFFRKMIDNAKTTAKTGAANARSTIGSRPSSRAGSVSPTKSLTGGVFGGGAGSTSLSNAARDMGLGGGGSAGSEWMQVRRDVNRSNSLSQRERDDRAERCEMLEIPVLNPIDQLHELAEGDEGLDGLPVSQPTDFHVSNLALVDKSTRFIQSVPSMVGPAALAQTYICRPHRSDVQRLRAIFTWVAERITWEEDFVDGGVGVGGGGGGGGGVDLRRVVQTRRGSSEEMAVLVYEMCSAVGLHAEVVRGYLKTPGEVVEADSLTRPNHWWNAVIVDGEWRIMDCALAAPTNARRSAYSSASSQVAESWYFLARPLEICYTHVPISPEQQHIVPPVHHELLLALPCACPPYFRHTIELSDFDTSILHLEGLEMTHLHINVPEDVECVAEVEARGFAHDADGDVFESGDVVHKPALAQPEWIGGRKRFTVKAVLPGDDGRGVLKVYAGKRGLMHSIKDNPHALAVSLPLSHTGRNPPYDFLLRHPTPHAQRHDLYVAQPQCARLGLNNTFVFCVRQHPSSLSRFTPDTWTGPGVGGNGGRGSATISSSIRSTSPSPFARPSSAMSMLSATVSNTGSNYSNQSSVAGDANYNSSSSASHRPYPMTAAQQQKPAKLAIQSPSQKIIRLARKAEHGSSGARGAAAAGVAGRDHADDDNPSADFTTTWETVIKIGERGTWRGLVLADRSARWCVFAEWECV